MTIRRSLDPRRRALTVIGFAMAAAVLVAVAVYAEPFQPDAFGPGQDARAYWAASLDAPYAPRSVGLESAYLYSPAFLQLLAPLKLLPWTAFLVVWTALLLVVLYRLVGPVLFAPAVVLTLPELWGGNVTILMAAAIVLGFRHAGAWAFVLLTKVTPGVGLLWFALRREWRSLLIASGLTALIVAVSAFVAPELWRDWIRLLTGSIGSSTVPGSIPIPLLIRLPLAMLVVLYAARTDRAWLVPVAAFLAVPVLWWGSFAMLAGAVALRRGEIEDALLSRLDSLLERPRSGQTGSAAASS